jgi:hypothetical protein
VASYQPAEPLWFLPLIGVDPVCRGRGHGSHCWRTWWPNVIATDSWRIWTARIRGMCRCMNATGSSGSVSSMWGHVHQSIRCGASHGRLGAHPSRDTELRFDELRFETGIDRRRIACRGNRPF